MIKILRTIENVDCWKVKGFVKCIDVIQITNTEPMMLSRFQRSFDFL